jgi:hypothetical protein
VRNVIPNEIVSDEFRPTKLETVGVAKNGIGQVIETFADWKRVPDAVLTAWAVVGILTMHI